MKIRTGNDFLYTKDIQERINELEVVTFLLELVRAESSKSSHAAREFSMCCPQYYIDLVKERNMWGGLKAASDRKWWDDGGLFLHERYKVPSTWETFIIGGNTYHAVSLKFDRKDYEID